MSNQTLNGATENKTDVVVTTTLRHCSEPSTAEITAQRFAQTNPTYQSDHAAREIRQSMHCKQ